MRIKNVEFKARCSNLEEIEESLLRLNPQYKGLDHQVDTYFNVKNGRLKLREGNIENSLIYYERNNTADIKNSKVILYKHNPDKSLKTILNEVHGIKVVVDKKRKIYFIENVKFHFDEVSQLGTFVEVEAIDTDNKFSNEELKQQCEFYQRQFGIDHKNMVDKSYSDLILENA